MDHLCIRPFGVKYREWSIAEYRELWPFVQAAISDRIDKGRAERTLRDDICDDLSVFLDLVKHSCEVRLLERGSQAPCRVNR